MQVGELIKLKNYKKALKLLEDAKDNPNYGHHLEQIYTSMISINNTTKSYQNNIKVWNEGHKRGMIFDINPLDKEFMPYSKVKGFKNVLRKEADLKKEKSKRVKATKKIEVNDPNQNFDNKKEDEEVDEE
jgi:hypothetical protein